MSSQMVMVNRSHSPSESIHILNDDSLLNIFTLCRPLLSNEDEAININTHMLPGEEWSRRERWWYNLVHVCQRWRRLIFASASYLRICHVCTHGTQVGRMLAQSPILPLVVDYADETRGWTEGDGEGLWFALLPERRDRVRRIRLLVHGSYLWNFVAALFDGTFPMLECLFVKLRKRCHESPSFKLPHRFRAARLRHLVLTQIGFPLASPILVTSVHVVTLSLNLVKYCLPNDLLERLLSLPRLEALNIASTSPISEDFSVASGQGPLWNTPLNTHVTLSNLHSFGFQGDGLYLKALLPGMTTPLLGGLQTAVFNQMTPSVSCLLSCTTTADNPNFSIGSAWFRFHRRGVSVRVCPSDGDRTYVFSLHAFCRGLNSQLFFVSQLFDGPSLLLASVVDLSLAYSRRIFSSEQHNDTEDRCTHWRNLLRSFKNVEILRVYGELSRDISRALLLGSEAEPVSSRVLLPRLKELRCTAMGDLSDAGNALAAFIHACEAAGHPVRLVHATVPVLPPVSTGISSGAYQS